MRLSKTEVNLRRLLAAAPHQQNQAKLIHYVTTLREQLEQLGAEITPEGIPSVSKAKLNEYSEKIEALAAKLSTPWPEPMKVVDETKDEESPFKSEQDGNYVNRPPGLRRRTVAHEKIEDSIQESKERDSATPIKLDAAAQSHIEKHRKLQEDLTDEMVVLAHQLKESSLLMNRSLQDTEKLYVIMLDEILPGKDLQTIHLLAPGDQFTCKYDVLWDCCKYSSIFPIYDNFILYLLFNEPFAAVCRSPVN
uniref:Uncharacterized protein LOC105048970 isoform X1 n=1 Tax=Elaeis guineensis var. tenera TaxID=51953 RepID=A0A8N4I9V0_ELAGV|nr:uncharacterized protein LOC105048970 isoform X1 [Elaeis guineensis]XP_029121541.1 uncharacterized protein LOC105048970 isoform X1 [Elaeis guineensis]XP_029121542.1 uncharacterized protein LOC105048970 isoform X1 [Elaeis guineensis]XP_029121543.1 uncharacterized protein LOC105048970 isoform X1 [Elaeis guineensis]